MQVILERMKAIYNMERINLRKYISITIILSLILTLCSCGADSGNTPDNGEDEKTNLDKYFKIGDAELGEDFDDRKIILIHVEWTNYTDEETTLWWHYSVTAYQNGVELDKSYLADSSTFESDYLNLKTNIEVVAPGKTINTYYAYKLDDDSSPVEFEVKDGGDRKDMTFKIE